MLEVDEAMGDASAVIERRFVESSLFKTLLAWSMRILKPFHRYYSGSKHKERPVKTINRVALKVSVAVSVPYGAASLPVTVPPDAAFFLQPFQKPTNLQFDYPLTSS